MANLKVLRQRIASVQSTIKITSAMKMVAASKLKRLQDQKETWSSYETSFHKMMQEACVQVNHLDTNALWFSPNQDSKIVAILILSSSKGLCGPFNTGVIKETKLMIQGLEDQGFIPELFFVGRRAKDALNSQFSKYFSTLPMQESETDDETARRLSELLSLGFLKGHYRHVNIIFNAYLSVMAQKPEIIELLPLKFETSPHFQRSVCEIEPSAGEFLELLCPRYLEVLMLKALIETHVGEQASRMVAMDAATRSAKEMVDGLKLQLNRTRQSLITKELIEVISGAEAAL